MFLQRISLGHAPLKLEKRHGILGEIDLEIMEMSRFFFPLISRHPGSVQVFLGPRLGPRLGPGSLARLSSHGGTSHHIARRRGVWPVASIASTASSASSRCSLALLPLTETFREMSIPGKREGKGEGKGARPFVVPP